MTDTSGHEFFDEQLAQSKVKSEIVAKYFWSWGKNMMKYYTNLRQQPFTYVDLFCGPGMYRDGSRSTPLLVVDRVLGEDEFSRWTQLIFNDVDADAVSALRAEIESLPRRQDIYHAPQYTTFSVGPEITALFGHHKEPTFTFLDPRGYAMLSRELIAASIRNRYCDSITFFNYLRVNMAISNRILRPSTYSLFGRDRAESLAIDIEGLASRERETRIRDEFTDALREVGVMHPLFFRIRHRSMDRASHFLVFASKHGLGHSIMKDIMSTYCGADDHGVPDYRYDPSIANQDAAPVKQMGLGLELDAVPAFEFRPMAGLDELIDDLSRTFRGQTLKVKDVFSRHQLGKPYIKANYKDALLVLEERSHVRVDAPAEERPKRNGKPTIGDDRIVSFTEGKG